MSNLSDVVQQIHAQVAPLRGGEKAVYIPQLAKINEEVRTAMLFWWPTRAFGLTPTRLLALGDCDL